ncbi:MAG: hypothetical protein II007_02870 [Gammaproteobacteria bacterium]|nr:hypothetical protein [Gammaproteobacteria bacterium]
MRWWWLLALVLGLLQLWPQPDDRAAGHDELRQQLATVAPAAVYDQRGDMVSADGDMLLDAAELARLTAGADWPGSPVWRDGQGRDLVMAARHASQQYYFANSYLVGFAPWLDAPLWQPLQVAALRKGYRLDEQLYGRPEVWQNSAEAFVSPWGDCEDHALFVADWLIALGHDARVALGNHDGEGHAWVVVAIDGIDYLIEATDKSRLRGANPYPPAISQRSYQADYQFNRQQFWVRQHPGRSYDREGREWRLASRFLPQSSD